MRHLEQENRGLERSWEALGEVVGGYGAVWLELLPKLGPRCALDGRSWPQGAIQMSDDSAKLGDDDAQVGHDSAKIDILSST